MLMEVTSDFFVDISSDDLSCLTYDDVSHLWKPHKHEISVL
jgi:hypothetical protein